MQEKLHRGPCFLFGARTAELIVSHKNRLHFPILRAIMYKLNCRLVPIGIDGAEF